MSELSAYVIRPANLDDIEFLADVVFAATRAQGRLAADFDEKAWRRDFCRWTTQQVGEALSGNVISVVEVDGERLGRLRVARRDGIIELAGIQLDPTAQGRGVGTAIIESIKTEAAAAGVAVELAVEKDNPNARRLYDRLGFVEVGETEDEHRLRWMSPPADGRISVGSLQR